MTPGRAPNTGRTLVSPSVMCADLLNLERDVTELVELGSDFLHLDIMDGHYVPNLTLGTDLCRRLRARCATPLDIHLMVDDPDTWGPLFAKIGSQTGSPGRAEEGRPFVTIHPETTWHPARTLAAIREAGGRPGIAIDPAQQVGQFATLLGLVDMILVMCVNPGYAGQSLLPWTIETIAEARRLREERSGSYLIEVDGNVSWDNIPEMISSGADVLVAGTSSIFDPSLSRAGAFARLGGVLGSL